MEESKKRIDILLVEKGFFESRAKAQAALLAGLVFVDGQKETKSGHSVASNADIEVKGKPFNFVSRGGLKIEKALSEFDINVTGKVGVDIGASTGGFTDCLLQKGARTVYAVDVGYGQLDWKLRQDKRVIVLERTNARNLEPGQLYGDPDKEKAAIVTVDASFISVAKLLPAIKRILSDEGEVIALIKPQFEAERGDVGKGGIVKDKEVHKKVLERFAEGAKKKGFLLKGATYSPITGPDGNIEFLVHLGPSGKAEEIELGTVVDKAHEELIKKER